MYCSAETHSWVQRAVEILGLGNKALRRISVNAAAAISDVLKPIIKGMELADSIR
jgi:glutamate/tyrosine decarboxylase-like PLP-dependent enzyme